jgi:hypothetical protein
MPKDFIKQQLGKLLEGKTLLILTEMDFEQLVLAAVPALRAEADELEDEGKFVQAHALQRLARELSSSPNPTELPIRNLSTSVH